MVFTPNMQARGFVALRMVVRLARWLVDTAPLNRWHMLVNGSHTRPTPFPKWFSAPHKLSYFFIQLAPFNMRGPCGHGAHLYFMFSHIEPCWLHLVAGVPGRVIEGGPHLHGFHTCRVCFRRRVVEWLFFARLTWNFFNLTHQRGWHLKRSLLVDFGEMLWILSGFCSTHTLSHGKDNGQWTRRLGRAPEGCNSAQTTGQCVVL